MEKSEKMEAKERSIKDVAETLDEVEETEREDVGEMVIRLYKPCMFEGKEYREIDLSGAEDMSLEDMIRIERRITRTGNTVQKNSLEYAKMFAAEAAMVPLELLSNLHPKDATKIQSAVTLFLYA